jgi:pimeloyl-ACP methyl ester carboxylesterase
LPLPVEASLMPTKYIDVEGTAVHYLHGGPTTLPDVLPSLDRGVRLVFVHGAGSNGHVWHRQVDAFAADHSPVAPDFPGHGRSGGIEGLRGVAAYADFLAAFMDALGIDAAVVVGHGMGSAVAIALALAHAPRVQALVLVAAAAPARISASTLQVWEDVMRGRAQQPFTTEAFSPQTEFAVMREAWAEQVATDPRVRYHDLVAYAGFDPRPQLPQLRLPTLVVAGRDDNATPAAATRELHGAVAGSTLSEIEAAGHWVPIERHEEFNAVLARFVSELS